MSNVHPFADPVFPVRVVGVWVTRESTYRESRRRFRTGCWGDEPDPIWIDFDQLYQTLTAGEPGEYILRGA